MPIYEYSCLDCKAKFELRRSIAQADEAAECVQCHSRQTARAISRFVAFSHSGDGGTNSRVGGSGCAGCSAASCAGCSR